MATARVEGFVPRLLRGPFLLFGGPRHSSPEGAVLNCEYRRRQRGWRQGDLSQRVRIAQPWISLLEQGRWKPTPDQLNRLATALDLAVDDLLKPVVAAVDVAAEATE